GRVEGRSSLQKRAYFVSLLTGIDSDLGFVTHYDGPYSAVVDDSVNRLQTNGFLEQTDIETSESPTGFGIKRYDYRLTNEGNKAAATLKQQPEYAGIADARNAIVKAANPDRLTLSIAARVYFVLKRPAGSITRLRCSRSAGIQFDPCQ